MNGILSKTRLPCRSFAIWNPVLAVAACLLLPALFFSCAFNDRLHHRQFVFYKNEKKHKLVFGLPKGKSEETFRIGNDEARELFYYFGNGAVFYIARHATWQTVNKHRIDALDSNTVSTRSTFSGKDKEGLHWKEITFEEFKIGYAYVSALQLEKFNQALNSVKIR